LAFKKDTVGVDVRNIVAFRQADMAGDGFTFASQVKSFGSDVDFDRDRLRVFISTHIDCIAAEARVSVQVGFVGSGYVIRVADVDAG